MGKGQHLTPHQRAIAKRYYENKETIQTQKLGEIVSDLYVTTDPKEKNRLWKRARTALLNADVHEGKVEKVIESRDIDRLVRVLEEVF